MPKSEVHDVCRYGRCDKTGPLAVSWATAFRLRQFALGSLWVLPLAGGLLGVLLGSGSIWADQSVHLPPYWTYSTSTASTVLSAIVGAMAALTGFVVTVTVLVVQMATSTFSARYNARRRLTYPGRPESAPTQDPMAGSGLTLAVPLVRRHPMTTRVAPRPEPTRASSTSPGTISVVPGEIISRELRKDLNDPAAASQLHRPWSGPHPARRAPIGKLRNPPTVA